MQILRGTIFKDCQTILYLLRDVILGKINYAKKNTASNDLPFRDDEIVNVVTSEQRRRSSNEIVNDLMATRVCIVKVEHPTLKYVLAVTLRCLEDGNFFGWGPRGA